MKTKYSIILILIIAFAISCKKDSDDNTFNIFSIEDDIAFGSDLQNEIHNNPAQYPILSKSQYSEAYAHVYRIRDSILMSGDLNYADKF